MLMLFTIFIVFLVTYGPSMIVKIVSGMGLDTWWSTDITRYNYSLTSACGTRAGTSRPTSSTGAASSSTPSSTSSARRSTRFV